MRCTIQVALFAIASASDEAVQGDLQGDFDDDHPLHLLQRSARHSKDRALDNIDEVDEERQGPPVGSWVLQPKRAFGPDGTWATPYCKDLSGCAPYCPDGCNGAAFWWEVGGVNTRVGINPGYGWAAKKVHFMGCHAGRNVGGPIGTGSRGWINCLGSENSTKPPFWPTLDPSFMRANGNMLGLTPGSVGQNMEAYGHEYCPVGCDNDCAYFKFGHFDGCGSNTVAARWYGGGTSNAVGPGPYCPDDFVKGQTNNIMSFIWCGAPTTTTTTTTTEGPTTTLPGIDDAASSDDASAVGDPHIKTFDEDKFDIH